MQGIAAGLGAFAAAALIAAPAVARDWIVDASRSEILFDYSENGKPAKGVFHKLSGEGSFEPDDPGAARLVLTIAIASIDLGDPLETAFVKGGDWFDADGYPEAVFILTGLEPLVPGGGAYLARGDLTIKGVRRDISAPMTLTIGGGEARATGLLALNRRDFRVGVGLSDRLISIGESITVRFDLTATEAGN